MRIRYLNPLTKKAIVIIALLIIAWFLFIFFRSKESTVHHIKLTDNGFVPSSLVIKKGDTVIFSTTRNTPFWPASDLHPTHELYAAFDPKKPIDADTSWVFRFEAIGEWGFHDHLAPLFKGNIHVIPARDSASALRTDASLTAEECYQLPDMSSKKVCWKHKLVSVLQQKGIPAAFDLFAEFYTHEPDFALDCHPYTHEIGEQAYEKFHNKEDFNISAQVSYCSYGFYHGFMEAMLQKTGKLDQARELCDYIDKQLQGQAGSIGTLGACFHGIGHGVTDGSDPRTHGDAMATIKPGLELCQKVGRDEREVKLCATGVFNSLASLYLNPDFHLDRNDPFWICRQQTTSYFMHACYDDLKTLTMALADDNFERATHFYNSIEGDQYAKDAMDNLATYAVYAIIRHNTLDDAIRVCHGMQDRMRVACIQGLGAGYMTGGTPEKEHIQALNVCRHPMLAEDERVGCYQRVLWISYADYSAQKHRLVCDMVDPAYRKPHCDTI